MAKYVDVLWTIVIASNQRDLLIEGQFRGRSPSLRPPSQARSRSRGLVVGRGRNPSGIVRETPSYLSCNGGDIPTSSFHVAKRNASLEDRFRIPFFLSIYLSPNQYHLAGHGHTLTVHKP